MVTQAPIRGKVQTDMTESVEKQSRLIETEIESSQQIQ